MTQVRHRDNLDLRQGLPELLLSFRWNDSACSTQNIDDRRLDLPDDAPQLSRHEPFADRGITLLDDSLIGASFRAVLSVGP